jgi:SH3 domain-containing YSC84-like protein 1
VVRDETGTWRAPVFISMTGGSIGWQAGIQATDIILVFVTRSGVRGLLRGKFTIGADAAVSAGPIGREATLATDASLRAEIYSYSRSRGLFLGLALDGSALQVDSNATARYYQSMGSAAPSGQAPPLPPSTVRLMETIVRYTTKQQAGAGAIGPGPAGAPAEDPQALRNQLVGSAQRLDTILDEAWRRYLALPAELQAADRRPTAEAIHASLARFNTVATSPTYRNLAARAEFQDTYRLLQRFAAVQTPSARLPLAQPPR